MRVSYSALSSFNQCPLKYKWQFIDRVRVPSTPDQFFGGLIHSVLEFALKNGELLPLEKLLEYYKNNWQKDVFLPSHPEQSEGSRDSSQAQNDSKNKEKEFYDSGLEMIKNFYADHQPSQITVLNTEKFFEIYWLEHKIVGKIDRIDKLPTGEIEIIDYKTNKKLPNEDDFKYDWQLPLYAWAAQTLFCDSMSSRGGTQATRRSQNDSEIASNIPRNDNNVTIQQFNNLTIESCPPIKLTFYYLRHNKKIAPPNAKTLEELQKYIQDTISQIQASSFHPQTSPLCGWCEYLHLCSEGQEFIKVKHSANLLNANYANSHNSNNKIRRSSNKISQDQQSLF